MFDNFPFPFPDQIHNLNSYVRDFYFFRRNFYPQLSLVAIDPDNAMASLERQVKWNYSNFFPVFTINANFRLHADAFTCIDMISIYIFFDFITEMKKKTDQLKCLCSCITCSCTCLLSYLVRSIFTGVCMQFFQQNKKFFNHNM